MAMEETADLNGKRIVVVEDDFVLATDICRTLRELGATVLGPAPTPFYAMHLIGGKKIDAAVLDVRLHGTTVFEVADLLLDRGVPIIFATASDRNSIPSRFHDAPLLEKPFDRKRLVAEIHAMTRRPLARPAKVMPPILPNGPVEAPAQTFARALARSMRTD
jgi:DNA-binding response OmpR family regulator